MIAVGVMCFIGGAFAATLLWFSLAVRRDMIDSEAAFDQDRWANSWEEYVKHD